MPAMTIKASAPTAILVESVTLPANSRTTIPSGRMVLAITSDDAVQPQNWRLSIAYMGGWRNLETPEGTLWALTNGLYTALPQPIMSDGTNVAILNADPANPHDISYLYMEWL